MGRPGKRPDSLTGDKAYSSRANRTALRDKGITTVIPEPNDQIANRKRRGRRDGRPPTFDPVASRRRNQVERPRQPRSARQNPSHAREPLRDLALPSARRPCCGLPGRLRLVWAVKKLPMSVAQGSASSPGGACGGEAADGENLRRLRTAGAAPIDRRTEGQGMIVLPLQLAALRQSTDRLLADVQGLTDEEIRQPSRLAEWTRGHVVGHLAAHARGLIRVTDAAERGELADPYPGGAEARAREIVAAARRPAAELIDDLSESVTALDRRWCALDDDVWLRSTRSSGGERPLGAGVLSRWTEVEVHHADLGLGYGPADWPQDYVAAVLPGVVSGLPRRATTPPADTWLLRCADTGESWLVQGGDDSKVVPGDAEARHVVAAERHELLAWLLGRTPGHAGWVREPAEASAALALPRWFPYP